MLLNDIVVLPEGGDFLTAISAGNGTLHERSEVVKDFTPEVDPEGSKTFETER